VGNGSSAAGDADAEAMAEAALDVLSTPSYRGNARREPKNLRPSMALRMPLAKSNRSWQRRAVARLQITSSFRLDGFTSDVFIEHSRSA